MRKSIFAGLVLAILLLMAMLPGQEGPAGAQDCAWPMLEGRYVGEFERVLTSTTTAAGLAMASTMSGGVDFNIECDGTITGEFTGAPGDTGHPREVRLVMEGNIKELGENGICVAYGTQSLVSGQGSRTPTGDAQLVLKVGGVASTVDCTGSEMMAGIMKSVLSGPAGGSSATTWTWVANEQSSETYAFGFESWGDPEADQAFKSMAQQGSASISQHWAIEHAGGSAPPGEEDEEEAPIVTALSARRGFTTFLENVPAVDNTFTAAIDWRGEQPLSVGFTIGGTTFFDDAPGDTAAVDIPIDNLPAGFNTITVVATAANDRSSPPFSDNIFVVPVPAWAKPFNLKAAPQDSFVLYQHTATRNLPAQPIQAQIKIPAFIPYIGGAWGIQPTQLRAGLSASSAGGFSDAPLTGAGGFTLAGRQFPLTLRSDSFVRTRMTEDGLLFEDGAARIGLAPMQFTHKLGLLEVVPGSGWLLEQPIIGPILKAADLSVFEAAISSELSGEGKLGVIEDDISLVGGQIKSDLSLTAAGGPNLGPAGVLQVVGSAKGSVTFGLTTPVEVRDCSLSASVFVVYGLLFVASGTIPNPPATTELVACNQFAFHGSGRSLAMPRRAASEPLRVVPRSASWQPETIAADPQETASGSGSVSATLVENTGAMTASPALASGADGRMALAWVSELPNRERPQAFQTRLRLFDGQRWGPPIAVSDDTRPDNYPAVAFDSRGQVVVAWMHSSDASLGPDTALTQDLLRTMEIGYAIVDATSGALKESGVLTDDRLLDFGPQLAAASDGTVWLAWQRSPSASLVGRAGDPNLVVAARWSGQEWSPVEEVTEELVGVIHWHLAALDARTALVLASARRDEASELLLFGRSGGRWTQPQTLASGLLGNVAVRGAYGAGGKPMAAWSDTGGVSGVIGDLSALPSLWLTGDVTLAALVPGAGDDLALLLAQTDATGKPSMSIQRLDPSTGKRTASAGLMEGQRSLTGSSAVAAPDGGIVFAAAPQSPRTMQVALPSGSTLQLPQAPELASIQLVRVPGVLTAAPPAASQSPDNLFWLLALGGGIAALLLGAGGLLLARRQR